MISKAVCGLFVGMGVAVVIFVAYCVALLIASFICGLAL
jgi:hypothetical protein